MLKSKLAKEGNKGSKKNFNFLNYKHNKQYIGAIKDEKGNLHINPEEITTMF